MLYMCRISMVRFIYMYMYCTILVDCFTFLASRSDWLSAVVTTTTVLTYMGSHVSWNSIARLDCYAVAWETTFSCVRRWGLYVACQRNKIPFPSSCFVVTIYLWLLFEGLLLFRCGLWSRKSFIWTVLTTSAIFISSGGSIAKIFQLLLIPTFTLSEWVIVCQPHYLRQVPALWCTSRNSSKKFGMLISLGRILVQTFGGKSSSYQ